MISVILPVKNGADHLRRCLDGIKRQRVDHEVETVVIDSGSRDDTVGIARAWGALVHEIGSGEFRHGATRNIGAERAQGDLFAFTSQDAYAERDDWLERLTAPLEADETLAGVYGRQLPHVDATPPERFFLDFVYGPEPREQRIDRAEGLSMHTTMFSNANSAMRRALWEQFPFADDMVFAEDQDWARRVLVDGHAIRYEPEAVVCHSHAYTIRTAFKRFFDSGASAERGYLAGGRPASRVLLWEAARYARDELRWLSATGQRRWIPYTAVYELAKFTGLQLGAHHRRLPAWLKGRLSFFPDWKEA
jgi:glycosyltransferase involved in cell wall biosynthesis